MGCERVFWEKNRRSFVEILLKNKIKFLHLVLIQKFFEVNKSHWEVVRVSEEFFEVICTSRSREKKFYKKIVCTKKVSKILKSLLLIFCENLK